MTIIATRVSNGNFRGLLNARKNFFTQAGKIERINGMTIEANGIAGSIGDVCIVTASDGREIVTEVVGVDGKSVFLMPYTTTEGIGYGSSVINTNQKMSIPISDDLIGRAVDPLCNPLDGSLLVTNGEKFSIGGTPSNPLSRPPITDIIEMGVKAIDGLLTIGKGQRMGIFAGSGVGKSTLMGMLARNVKADVNVIALVGERGREVLEFINRDLGPEGIKRSVLVIATSDQPAMMRYICPMAATTIAEYFCAQGKDVLLMMDSLTRYAMAQREIGLSSGEAPVARGYTPSIYAAMPKLLERTGNFETGSITGIFTVLVEGDDTNEPVADTVRSIIDGHIMLDRKIASKNHYPAINALGSVSRLMNEIASPEHKAAASKMRNMMAIYRDYEDLISIGAYKSGTNPELDEAIAHMGAINGFLTQATSESFSVNETIQLLQEVVA